MKTLRFECPIDDLPGFHADAVMGDTVFEVLIEPRDARRLRAALMEMARVASRKGVQHVVLVLDEPRITEKRLRDEWDGVARLIRPELFAQFSMAIKQSGAWTGLPNPPDEEGQAVLDRIVEHKAARQPARSTRRAEAYYEILRLLMHQWMLGKGPIAINWLKETSGTSYPTVSRALDRLGHYLNRHSDRSVELRFFPRDEWARLLAVADDVRGTARFADRSGQPRSPEAHLRRLEKLDLPDLGIGGVFGARHYYPEIDLVGTPRLDLSLHCPVRQVSLGFIEKLDPGLARENDPNKPASVVVHAIRIADPLFNLREEGLHWADPVECLMDLHEARLESQAREFLEAMVRRREKTI